MASKQYKQAIAKARAGGNLDELLVGSNAKYIGKGRHKVRIQAVDSSEIAETDRVKFIFQDTSGKDHNERFWITSTEGDFSYNIRKLWGALFGQKDVFTKAVDLFMAELDRNERAFEMFTGAELLIELDQSDGFTVQKNVAGLWVPVDIRTNIVLEGFDEGFEKVADAKEAAQAAGFKKSYLKIVAMEMLDDATVQRNFDALNFAVTGKQKAQAATSGTSPANAGPGKKAVTLL